jgi:hypothetical protein
MTTANASPRDQRNEHPIRVPRYVTIPSRADGISRALRKSFGSLGDMPSDLGDLVERLKRINA